MSRRLVLTVATAAVLGGGLAGAASAATPSTQGTHAVCVMTGSDGTGLVAPGYCVWWDGVTPTAN